MNTLGVPAYLWGVILLNKAYIAGFVGAVGVGIGALIRAGPPHTWPIF